MIRSVFHRLLTAVSGRPAAALAALVLCGAAQGCGRQEAQFTHRAGFENLMPEAQSYVHEALEQHFGTPTQVVAWEQLPIKLHAAAGAVGAAPDARSIAVNYSQQNLPIEPGLQTAWLSGPLLQSQGDPAWVEAVDVAGRIMFEQPLASVPAEGDRVAIGPGEVLRYGRVLYAEHCQHCHGVSGDAQGPTASYLNPRPRDFRRGIFKFTTTTASNRASRADLARVIENGVPGTYMPSFKLLSDAESMAIIEYVLFLSMRGEVEYQLVTQLGNDYSNQAVKDRIDGGETRKGILDEFTGMVNGGDMQEQFNETVESIVTRWVEANEPEAIIVPGAKRPPATPESIARGRMLYLSQDLNCVACHGEAALGDGPQSYSITKNAAGEDNPTPGLYDEWGNLVKPRNLTQGIYRGGRRPIDLFARLHGGIKGTPMPAFGGKKTDEELWDLVNYILSVPFEVRHPGDGLKEARPVVEDVEQVATR
ncbi:MAG: cytochrome c [Planctomyces sp.]|nr:cytochrome c [Planctomyces sp.]